MRRILAGMGVLGLIALATTATATASPQDAGRTITICHATGSELNPYIAVTVSVDAINGPNDHMGAHHDEDIIPPNGGSALPGGRNLDKIDWWEAGCKDPSGTTGPVVPLEPDPVVVPEPVVVPDPDPVGQVPVVPDRVLEPAPVEVPGTGPVEPAPAGVNVSPDRGEAPSSKPMAAGFPVTEGSQDTAAVGLAGRNQGYGVQTAFSEARAETPWLAGLTALLAAGAVVAARRSVGGGTHTGR